MDIHHLKYYVAVVESNNFTKDTEKLQVTQPILTRTVKQLKKTDCQTDRSYQQTLLSDRCRRAFL